MPPCGVMQKIIKTVLFVTKLGNLGQKKQKTNQHLYTYGVGKHTTSRKGDTKPKHFKKLINFLLIYLSLL